MFRICLCRQKPKVWGVELKCSLSTERERLKRASGGRDFDFAIKEMWNYHYSIALPSVWLGQKNRKSIRIHLTVIKH